MEAFGLRNSDIGYEHKANDCMMHSPGHSNMNFVISVFSFEVFRASQPFPQLTICMVCNKNVPFTIKTHYLHEAFGVPVRVLLLQLFYKDSDFPKFDKSEL